MRRGPGEVKETPSSSPLFAFSSAHPDRTRVALVVPNLARSPVPAMVPTVLPCTASKSFGRSLPRLRLCLAAAATRTNEIYRTVVRRAARAGQRTRLHQIHRLSRAHGPAHDLPAEHVQHRRQIHKPFQCRHIRDVSYPQAVRLRGLETALDPVRRHGRLRVPAGRATPLPPRHPLQAQRPHQPRHPPPRHRHALCPQLRPYPPRPVGLPRLGVDCRDPSGATPCSAAPADSATAATRNTRWWRPPANGTCGRSDIDPDSLLRIRTPLPGRIGLPSEPGRCL